MCTQGSGSPTPPPLPPIRIIDRPALMGAPPAGTPAGGPVAIPTIGAPPVTGTPVTTPPLAGPVGITRTGEPPVAGTAITGPGVTSGAEGEAMAMLEK